MTSLRFTKEPRLPARYWIALGAVLAAAAVAAGALGAHLLKDLVKREVLSSDQLASFETAVRYQMFHALALVLAGLLLERSPTGLVQAAAIAFLLGIVLFSGGIYGWLATGIKPLVHVVPVGGLTWIVGWLLLAAGALRR